MNHTAGTCILICSVSLGFLS